MKWELYVQCLKKRVTSTEDRLKYNEFYRVYELDLINACLTVWDTIEGLSLRGSVSPEDRSLVKIEGNHTPMLYRYQVMRVVS